MRERLLGEALQHAGWEGEGTVLEVDDIHLSFAGVKAIDGVSFTVSNHELFAIIGPNGAGKTSIFNCLSGVYHPQQGSVRFLGEDILHRKPHKIAGMGMARTFQNIELFPNLTVLDNLMLGRHRYLHYGPLSAMAWLGRTKRLEAENREVVEAIIQFLELEPFRKSFVAMLPYGVQKRVELGRALAMEPKLLLLDEPAAGMNTEETEDMARAITDIKRELGIGDDPRGARHACRDGSRRHGARHRFRQADRPRPARPDPEAPRRDPRLPRPGARGGRDPSRRRRMTTTEPARRTDVTTVASLIAERARNTPDAVAMREKRLGIWQETTWAGYWDTVQNVAHALLALGVEPGDRVAIHSENRPEWIASDAACAAIRATCMGLYPTNPTPEVEYLLANSGSKILIAEDQEQVDKTLEVKGSLAELEKIIYIEPRGVDVYDDPMLMSWDELLQLGRSHRAANAAALDERMSAVEPEDVAYLIYTSGTTGPPKGAMLTVRNVEFACRLLRSNAGFVDPAPSPTDELVSYLPLCHVYEKGFGHWLNAAAGTITNFGESLDTLTTDMREIQPTIFEAVPRIWEKMHAAIIVRMASASRFKKLNYGYWMRTAERLGRQLVASGGSWTIGMRIRYALGSVFLFRALKERLGLSRVRHGITAAAPIAPEVIEFFMGIGVPVYEAYGMTESSAIGTTNRAGRIRLGTVGEAFESIELRLDEHTGEILMRHPGVFIGYWRNPEATAETIDEEGWLHTGDVAEWVDGTHVKIVDRIKDIIITAGGKNISPSRDRERPQDVALHR